MPMVGGLLRRCVVLLAPFAVPLAFRVQRIQEKRSILSVRLRQVVELEVPQKPLASFLAIRIFEMPFANLLRFRVLVRALVCLDTQPPFFVW